MREIQKNFIHVPMPIVLGSLPVLRVDEAITFNWHLREWFQVSELADLVWLFGET